jgi:hypothetical protein
MDAGKTRRGRQTVFQEIMLDVHRQWLAEFDREQALRRQVPRRRWRRRERQPADARRLPEAPQCI